jgi:hypothetical protein
VLVIYFVIRQSPAADPIFVIMALVQQSREFIFFKNFQLDDERLNFFIAGIRMRYIRDLFGVAGHTIFLDSPKFRFPSVVSDKKRRVGDASVTFALSAVARTDRDIVGLTFDDDQWWLAVALV